MSAIAPTRAAALALAGAALSGCNCRSDVGYTPFTGPPILENDHGQWLSMDVGPNESLVVSYYDRTRGAVGFAVGAPQEDGEVWWTHEQVDGYPDRQGLDPGDLGWFTSIAVAPSGRVWVAYHDQGNGSLRAAYRDGGAWTAELADAGSGLSPDAGQWASLALDADGNPVVAHHDAAAGTLRISRRSAEGTWSTEVAATGTPGVDGEGGAVPANVGRFARLLIANGVEYVAFYDAAHGDLRLIEGFSGAWTSTVIDEAGDVGQWPSLWLDGERLLVAYHDVTNQDLKLARRVGGGAFTTEVLDSDELVGADTEVFVDQTGGIGVVYFDGQFNDMRVTRDVAGFETSVLGGDGLAVGYHNEVAFAGGKWWVASYDYTNRRIFAQAL